MFNTTNLCQAEKDSGLRSDELDAGTTCWAVPGSDSSKESAESGGDNVVPIGADRRHDAKAIGSIRQILRCCCWEQEQTRRTEGAIRCNSEAWEKQRSHYFEEDFRDIVKGKRGWKVRSRVTRRITKYTGGAQNEFRHWPPADSD